MVILIFFLADAEMPTTIKPKPTAPTTTTIAPTTTTRAPCIDKNMTVYVTSDMERALVEITPNIKTGLSVGSHVIYRDDCTINVRVSNKGEC